MLSKKEKNSIWYLAVIFLFGGILHVLLRNVDFTDCFSQVFYGCVVLFWSVTIRERIINYKVRHILYAIIFFMEMYFVLQICKYRLFFNNRTVWAYYYIPMLIIPILLLDLSLSINRKEREKLDKRLILAAIPGALLVLMIITNNLHMWFLKIDSAKDEIRISNAGVFYYLYWMYVVIMFVAVTVILFRKCRISISKKRVGILAFTYVMCVGSFLLHAIGITLKINGVKLWNIGELFAFCMICILEVCIKIGLIPANSNYKKFFYRTDIPAVIKDSKDEVVYTSAKATKFTVPSEDEYIQTQPISGGSVSYMVNLATVNALNREIEDVTEQITVRNNYLKTQNSLKEERASVDARNRVYDRIAEIVSSQTAKINEILDDKETEYASRFKKIAVYNAYIKRRSNMELLSESEKTFSVSEIVTAIAESAEYIKLNDIEVMFSPFATGTVSADIAILTYEFFEEIAEIVLEEVKMMSVILTNKEDILSLRVVINSVKLQFIEKWKEKEVKSCGGKISITKDEEDTIIALSFEKGGEAL
ncbi:MAG: histidine kinase N-terminal 7TM domain-containing protein [Eubacteriales bacterium]|nr:histidine kinase N-terminal 7TM domain-containing protein [Eubacteriales bacterium]